MPVLSYTRDVYAELTESTRSRRQGYAFVEFEHRDVAEIVADTMDNYLLYGRLMQCKIVAPEKVGMGVFLGACLSVVEPMSNNRS